MPAGVRCAMQFPVLEPSSSALACGVSLGPSADHCAEARYITRAYELPSHSIYCAPRLCTHGASAHGLGGACRVLLLAECNNLRHLPVRLPVPKTAQGR